MHHFHVEKRMSAGVFIPLSLMTNLPFGSFFERIFFVTFKSTFNVARSRLFIPIKSAPVFTAEQNSDSVWVSSKTSRPNR